MSATGRAAEDPGGPGPLRVGHGAAAPSSGTRDIFHLPVPGLPTPVPGRGRAARLSRRAFREATGVQDAVRSLNWLNGFDLSLDYPGEPDSMQRGVIQAAHGLVCLQQRGAEAPPSSRAALDELLRGRAIYSCGEAGNSLAPYQQGRVSLPDSVAGSPAVEEACGALGQFFLAGDGERRGRMEEDAQCILSGKNIHI